MKLFRKEEGFTLVELMVVVLIIGILVAVAVPVFNSAKASAQKRSCQSNQRAVESAFTTYYADNDGLDVTTLPADGSLASALSGALEPDYIKDIKNCPSTGTDVMTFTYSDDTSRSDINVDCPTVDPSDHSR